MKARRNRRNRRCSRRSSLANSYLGLPWIGRQVGDLLPEQRCGGIPRASSLLSTYSGSAARTPVV